MSDKYTQPRLDATKVSPDLYKAMLGLEKYVEGSGLEQKLLDLVKIRASQINGCALSCTPTTPASTAKATSGCICSTPGTRRRSTARASVQPSRGPKR